MHTHVYASKGGTRYHKTAKCRALLGGQLMNNEFKVFWVARNAGRRLYRVETLIVTDALGQGKEPCTACFPDTRGSLYRGNCENDFGHEPVWIDGDHFCARCRSRGQDEHGDPWSYPTLWPCASAVVLGLVTREVAA